MGFRLPESAEKVVLDTFCQALERLNESRATEGGAIGEDLLARLADQEREVEELATRASERGEEMRQYILERIKSLMDDTQIDDLRLSQEVVYYADRLDISEEITRLRAHLATTAALLRSDKRPLGKELDFMCQEQMREVTTIGNKAKHQWIADKVVLLKTGYEKIREQVQNLE